MLHVFWGIWGDDNKFQLYLPQDIDVKTSIFVWTGKNSIKDNYKFPFVSEFVRQKIQSMRVINSPVNTQCRTGWLEVVFK